MNTEYLDMILFAYNVAEEQMHVVFPPIFSCTQSSDREAWRSTQMLNGGVETF